MLRDIKLLGGGEEVFFCDPEVVLFIAEIGFGAAFGEDLFEKIVKGDLWVGGSLINGELISYVI